jgi:hypothetical protein
MMKTYFLEIQIQGEKLRYELFISILTIAELKKGILKIKYSQPSRYQNYNF